MDGARGASRWWRSRCSPSRPTSSAASPSSGSGPRDLTCAPGSVEGSRGSRIARSRHGAHRWQHVVRRGSPRRRRPGDPGLGEGIRALGLALNGSAPPRIDILLSHLPRRLGASGSSRRSGIARRSSTSGIRRRRCARCPVEISQYLSPPLFPVRLAEVPPGWSSTTRRTSRGCSVRPRSPRGRSSIEDRPSDTGSRTRGGASRTSPTSRRSRSSPPATDPSGYPVRSRLGRRRLIHDCQ